MIRRRRRPPAARLALIIAGVALLALSSQLAIPLRPVPITLQTLAVTLVGALMGPRDGTATVLLWLALAAAGLPLLADGGAGLDRFTGRSAGYLLGFPIAAALVGWLADRGRTRNFVQVFAIMLAGNLLILATGAAWLALSLGGAGAVTAGILPFLPGALLKALLGAGVVRLVRAQPSRPRRW